MYFQFVSCFLVLVTMAKRKSKRASGKHIKKLAVKSKFLHAARRLRQMKANAQKQTIANASNEFVRDVSSVMGRLRKRPDLVSSKHRKVIRRHRGKLQRLVNKKTSLQKKRKILMSSGGIFPALIPIIAAAIGAAGSVGAGAVGAAISRA